MSRVLIIPDLHNRFVTAQLIVDKVPHDKCIFLGDYFDNFGDTYREANNTAVWLRDVAMADPRNIFLIGNHDSMYFWPYHYDLKCSGYTDSKKDAIVKELSREHIEQFKFFYVDQGFLFTHAGYDNRMFKQAALRFENKGDKTRLEFVTEVLTYEVEQAKKQIALNQKCELLGAGWDRGGNQQIGGIDWIDFSNLSPIHGVNQIVGHTPHLVPDVKIQKKGGAITVKDIFEYYNVKHFPACKNPLSTNYALDTHSNHYMVIEDGDVQIWDVQHDMKIQDLQQYAIPESPMSGLSGLLPEGAWEEIDPKNLT